MTERRAKKKELAGWVRHRNELPRLIDRSRVFGDYTYSDEDLVLANRRIERIEKELEGLGKREITTL